MKTRIKIFCAVCMALLCAVTLHYVFAQTSDTQVIASLEFREVDIKDVLRQLAKQYNLNIVFSEAVKGLVTVQLTDVTIEQALDSIITVNGFAYTKKDNVYKVTTQDEAERQGKQTKLFKLNNADATALKATLEKVLSSEGTIEADKRSNSLVITDSPAVISKIDSMIPALDEITPQVLIETRLIETSLTVTEKLGIDWTTTISATGSKRPTTFPFNKWGSDKAMYPVPEYGTEIDDTTGRVTVTSDFPFKPNLFPNAESMLSTLGSFPMVEAAQFTFGTLDLSTLKTVFDFLKSRSNTRLVANPRIVTVSNQRALINVGKVLSLPRYERNDTTGKMEITGWTKENVGVSLEVTPQISPDGHIKIKLKPAVSNLIGYASTRDGVSEGPITSTRSAETEVQIRDGQTVVIGGLVKDEALSTVKKVPILGDIPLIGLLFTRKEVSSTENPTEKTDLLIFVTARIIKDTDSPLIASQSEMVTSLPRPFKLKARDIK